MAYAGLRDKEQTLAWLEKAYEERSGNLFAIRREDFFGFLRDDPRFADLKRRMNFP